MANAKKCDRCDKFYMTDDYKLLKNSKGINGYYVRGVRAFTNSTGIEEFDLCPECVIKFYDFMNPNICDTCQH